MANRSMVSVLSRLDVGRKWLLLGSILLAVSTILPWYEDADAFGAGDLYLGVTGPLFLVGLLVLVSAIFVSAWVVLPSMGRRLPELPVKQGALFAFLGLQDLFLLLIANSVFFHPKFGVNITLKNTKFGMIVAVLGAVLVTYSGYQLYRRDLARRLEVGPEGRLEPLIRMPEAERPHASHGRLGRAASPVEETVSRVQRDFSETVGARERMARGEQTTRGDAPPVRHEPIERSLQDKTPPQPLRMDL